MAIRFFDMFAGIGGFRSGLEAVGGFECVGYCEIDKYAKQAYGAMYDTKDEVYYTDHQQISLSLLSNEELERILCSDEKLSEETTEAMLRLLNERDPIDLPDAEQAWEEFQTCYNTPEGAGERLYPSELPEMETIDERPRKKRRPLRYVGLVAASIGILFALLTVAQAAGLKVFDALGRWTDDFFSFEGTAKTVSEYNGADFTPQNTLQQALADFGMPPQLAPSELPEGYQLSELLCEETPSIRDVIAYYSDEAEDVLQLSFTEYCDSTGMEASFYPKDAGDPERYVCNNREFYIFNNAGRCTAVWSDARYCENRHGVYSAVRR